MTTLLVALVGCGPAILGRSTGTITAATLVSADTTEATFGFDLDGSADLDGDGIAEVAVGAPESGRGGRYAGAVYIFEGAAEWPRSYLDADRTLVGEAPLDVFGARVASAGDADGDGLDDLLIGAPGAEPSGRPASGAVYLFGGGLGNLAVRSTFLGQEEDWLCGGNALPDINDDGAVDWIVGTSMGLSPDGGRIAKWYPYAGPIPTGTIDLAGVDASIQRGATDGVYRAAVQPMVDLDGDLVREVIVGETVWSGASLLGGEPDAVFEPRDWAVTQISAGPEYFYAAFMAMPAQLMVYLGDTSGSGHDEIAAWDEDFQGVRWRFGPFASDLVDYPTVLLDQEFSVLGSLRAADIDADGALDLVVAGTPSIAVSRMPVPEMDDEDADPYLVASIVDDVGTPLDGFQSGPGDPSRGDVLLVGLSAGDRTTTVYALSPAAP